MVKLDYFNFKNGICRTCDKRYFIEEFGTRSSGNVFMISNAVSLKELKNYRYDILEFIEVIKKIVIDESERETRFFGISKKCFYAKLHYFFVMESCDPITIHSKNWVEKSFLLTSLIESETTSWTTIGTTVTINSTAIPSQTTTTCNLCKVDTSVDTGFSGSFVTSTESNSQPGIIFTTIAPSTLKTGSNVVLSYKTTIFFSRITILFPGYTTTFVTEVYIPPSIVVVAKEVTAVILSVSTSTSTPSNSPKFLKPLLIGLGTGIVVDEC
ncbi:hypothetical protein Glove_168g134 [Diversispora epigaea]|uniref:Uncharacterized protein n=1 Tax=Diversispora epigaea TaxID=1348612 RepID=A0A397ITB2_9GLOM|nr:hypothetical protein Glove_168g134 [Diversispora epigaea]